MNHYMENQIQKLSQLLEEKQQEITKLQQQLEKYQSYDQQLDRLNDYIMQLNYQFEQQEQAHQEQQYFLKRELAFAKEEIKQLQRTRGPGEQQQIASLLKELSDLRQQNDKLMANQSKQRTISIQEHTINEIRRQSPNQRVKNHSFISPSQNLVKDKRIPSLPDVSSNRFSITKTSMQNIIQYHQKPPLQKVLNISPCKQQLFVRQ